MSNPMCAFSDPKPVGTCSIEKMDVTGDGIHDKVRICDAVELEWKGDEQECRRQFDRIVSGYGEKFTGTNGIFKLPLAILDKIGVAPSVCGEKAKPYREKLGLTAESDDGECFVTPYGRQHWMLSYPALKGKGLGVDDIRNYVINKFPKFGDKKIGIGLWGKFNLNDGRTISGVVVDIGFFRPWGEAIPNGFEEYSKARFSGEDFNVIIYTVDTKTFGSMGENVDMCDIKSVEELSQEEKTMLAKEYRKAHRSVSEIMEDIFKGQK